MDFRKDLPQALKEYIDNARLNDADTLLLTQVYNRIAPVPIEMESSDYQNTYTHHESVFFRQKFSGWATENFGLQISNFVSASLRVSMLSSASEQNKRKALYLEITDAVVAEHTKQPKRWSELCIEVKKDRSDWRAFLTLPAPEDFSNLQVAMVGYQKETAYYDIVNGNMINVIHYDAHLPHWDPKLVPMVTTIDKETEEVRHTAYNRAEFKTINIICNKLGEVVSQKIC